jgi:hypothetical protein
MREFNVFDEWGNYVGKFTPSGGGENAIIMFIVVILLWVFGFLVYALFRLLQEGLRALFHGKWITAALYLSPFLVVTLMIVFSITVSFATAIPAAIAQEAEQQHSEQVIATTTNHLTEADKAEQTLVIATPYGDVTVKKLSGLKTLNDIRSCRGYAVDNCEKYFGSGNRGFWVYEITIPNIYGGSMSLGYYNFTPDYFFGAKNNGYGENYHCFLEAWDSGVFQPEIYQSTNPALVYCEARADDNVKLELTFSNPTDWQAEPYNFKILLNPFTGLFENSK